MAAGRRIVVLGPFPPPVHGAAKNTRIISQRLSAAGARVTELRNNPASSSLKSSDLSHYVRKVLSGVGICAHLLWLRTQGRYALYSVPDGGLGLYFNLIQYTLARLCGAEITLHHRNYSHITTPNPAMRILTVQVCPDARHVFLSPSMASDFQAVYGTVREAMVVSNAGLLDYEPLPVSPSDKADRITIGHLSNLTAEKGFDVVADVMRRLSRQSDRYRFVLGGAPVNAREQARLEQLQADLGERLDYQGPVYGEEKARFFAACDVFLFPTRYRKEAQPNVLFEALAAGCVVLSTRRACIPDLLDGYEAQVFDETEDLMFNLVNSRYIDKKPLEYSKLKKLNSERMAKQIIESKSAMSKLLGALCEL